MKAVLILDMPESCEECDFLEWRKDDDWGDGDYCTINGVQCLNCKRPNNCPLQPLPEMRSNPALNTVYDWHDNGWNACIKAMTGNRKI